VTDREATTPRTHSILNDRVRNRGVAFSVRERAELGLTGRLPPAVLTLDQQAEHAYSRLRAMPAGGARKLYLEHLRDRNETLYLTVLSGHPAELLPIVADPLAGEGIGPSAPECYSPDGIYLSIDRPGDVEKSFATLGLGAGDVDIIVCSDGEEIPGIGDGGIGGLRVAAGKLAIYTAAAGIRPRRMIPVSLDAGTDNQALRGDPFYLGSRRARRRGQDYHAFIRGYVQTVSRLFPGALLHFEAIDPETARQILHAYGRGYRVFSDVQGTGAVVLAAVYAGVRVTGIPMKYQTVVAFGAGAAGVAIADQLRDAMVADGATEEQARSQIWLVGTPAPPELTETVDEAAPTILLGTSAVGGAFTRPVIEAMCRATSRPLILPVSGPASTAEAAPSDVMAWSDGRALVATGSAAGTPDTMAPPARSGRRAHSSSARASASA
jgi:malate dehydrogenase (oxaloacetate-decarboxylating)